MPNKETQTLRERSLQETDGNTLGSPEKDQTAQDLAKEANERIRQAFLQTPEGPHIKKPKKTFKEILKEQSKDPHGGHIINSEEE